MLPRQAHTAVKGLCCVALLSILCGCAGATSAVDAKHAVPSGGACSAAKLDDRDPTLEVESGGRARKVVLHFPDKLDGRSRAPLVVAYHFAAGSPKLMALVSSLNGAADERGFVVAYPEGVGGSWNAGKCCGEAWKTRVDDVAFTRALLDAIEARYCIDPDRVFATGMSNGALMTQRLGCEASDRFAAIAPVAGVVDWEDAKGAPGLGPTCRGKPVSVLQIHGTGDTSIPFAGGRGDPPVPLDGDLGFMSVRDSMRVWQGVAGCKANSKPVFAKGDASCVAWSSCASGAELELCSIEGGGHTWPSGYMPPVFGTTSSDLDASATILDFFKAHPRR